MTKWSKSNMPMVVMLATGCVFTHVVEVDVLSLKVLLDGDAA